jgi:hypothetical protein
MYRTLDDGGVYGWKVKGRFPLRPGMRFGRVPDAPWTRPVRILRLVLTGGELVIVRVQSASRTRPRRVSGRSLVESVLHPGLQAVHPKSSPGRVPVAFHPW